LLNDQILRVSDKVRCIGHDGEQFGVISTKDALEKAYDLDMDAVMVSGGDTPVVKIMDYNKFRYQAEKKKKEARKNQKKIEIKEIKLTPKIADNDIGYKVKHAIEFLESSKHVRFKVFLRGREISSPKLAFELLQRIISMIEEVGHIEQPPKSEGRHVTMYITPIKKTKKEVKHDAKDENM
jgi:translation initiation factor IF-3